MRRFDSQKLVLATHNKGKLREIAALLAPYHVDVTSVGDLGFPVPVETGTTFAENALIKAHAAAKASGLPALSDDSGLSVEALGGAPGVYSADWAEPGRNFTKAMQRVWDELAAQGKQTDVRAHFTCVLALAWPDGRAEVFEGQVHGALVWPPRGDQGFGYDPMFVPDGYDLTFGEMDPAAKHAISHRAKAFEKLAVFLTADEHR